MVICGTNGSLVGQRLSVVARLPDQLLVKNVLRMVHSHRLLRTCHAGHRRLRRLPSLQETSTAAGTMSRPRLS